MQTHAMEIDHGGISLILCKIRQWYFVNLHLYCLIWMFLGFSPDIIALRQNNHYENTCTQMTLLNHVESLVISAEGCLIHMFIVLRKSGINNHIFGQETGEQIHELLKYYYSKSVKLK